MFYFDTKLVILSRDVPGQRILLWDFCSCLCPETKGTRGQELFSVRDKETTGRPIPVCLGLSHPIWKPQFKPVQQSRQLRAYCPNIYKLCSAVQKKSRETGLDKPFFGLEEVVTIKSSGALNDSFSTDFVPCAFWLFAIWGIIGGGA